MSDAETPGAARRPRLRNVATTLRRNRRLSLLAVIVLLAGALLVLRLPASRHESVHSERQDTSDSVDDFIDSEEFDPSMDPDMLTGPEGDEQFDPTDGSSGEDINDSDAPLSDGRSSASSDGESDAGIDDFYEEGPSSDDSGDGGHSTRSEDGIYGDELGEGELEPSAQDPTTEASRTTDTQSTSTSTLVPTRTTKPAAVTNVAPRVTTTTTSTTPSPTATTTTTSPPRARLIFSSAKTGNQEIYSIEADGRTETRLTDHPGGDQDPAPSHDGSKIAFVSDRAGRPEIFTMNPDGTSPVRATHNAGAVAHPSWSPDGQRIAFDSSQPGRGSEIFMTAVGGGMQRLTTDACAPGRADAPCTSGQIDNRQPAFSPDGGRIAFIKDREARQDLYVMNADGSHPLRLGGIQAANPAWSPDGRSIAYDDIDGIHVRSLDPPGADTIVPNATEPCSPGSRCPVLLEPSWSPEGTRLATRDTAANANAGDIYIIEIHGQGKTRVGTNMHASEPRWLITR